MVEMKAHTNSIRSGNQVAARLLAWYDAHHRDLPWRVPPARIARGERPDPYRVWLSEVMLQQTTVEAVKPYFARFTARWPQVSTLAAAEADDVMKAWAGLGYYSRARNLKKCAEAVVRNHGGRFPDTEAGLRELPGIGAYTAAAVASIAFGRPAAVVDGNVERVVARLFAVETPLPAAKPELVALATGLTPPERPGDFAQAMMDLGATICTPRSPACAICPLITVCDARAQRIAADLPRKAPKTAKPERTGLVWVARQGDSVLLEHRPAKGLLGGTLAFPSAGWDGRDLPPPGPAEWRDLGAVRHVFTHFSLEMTVLLGDLAGNPTRGEMVPLRQIDRNALPGLMRKVWDVALPAIRG